MRNFGIPSPTHTITVPLGFGVRWWLVPYLRLVAHLDLVFGITPDPDKLQARILKGCYITLHGRRLPLGQ